MLRNNNADLKLNNIQENNSKMSEILDLIGGVTAQTGGRILYNNVAPKYIDWTDSLLYYNENKKDCTDSIPKNIDETDNLLYYNENKKDSFRIITKYNKTYEIDFTRYVLLDCIDKIEFDSDCLDKCIRLEWELYHTKFTINRVLDYSILDLINITDLYYKLGCNIMFEKTVQILIDMKLPLSVIDSWELKTFILYKTCKNSSLHC